MNFCEAMEEGERDLFVINYIDAKLQSRAAYIIILLAYIVGDTIGGGFRYVGGCRKMVFRVPGRTGMGMLILL